jgi:SAM-dependent MidA family methyltransferase
MTSSPLPTPSPEALALSQRVMAGLQKTFFSQKNTIPFADYMHYVLYEPGLGYYANGQQKFGPQGDFITAPELSPLFAQCLAQQCQQILPKLQQGCILELGAGSGALAAHLLLALEALECLPATYYILDLSSELQQRQRQRLEEQCPHLLPRVKWLSALPNPSIEAVVIANEVLDAMPITAFRFIEGKLYEMGVTLREGALCWDLLPLNDPLTQQITALFSEHPLNYQSEINLWLTPWLASLQQSLSRGVLLIIDYGFTQAEYYHPQRDQGTLMCHYQHHSHHNPLLYPGLQDITAHVDFTHIALAAHQQGWHVAGFCNQAHFLLGCNLINLAKTSDMQLQFDYNQQIKMLTMPHEMGELFKVMALTKAFDESLLGFALQDWRRKL